MKKHIQNINAYLLERYPLIWNTRLFWMLSIAVVLHLIFFCFGYLTLTDVTLLHESNAEDLYFDNGTVYLTAIISILILVTWLIFMFKNNSFKNFYPTSKPKLFHQFIHYILIIFSCTSFFISYNYGLKAYIANTYETDVVNNEIKVTNDAALFFSRSLSPYTIDVRNYPEPFTNLYGEENSSIRNFDTIPKLEFLDKHYSFYTLTTVEKKRPKRWHHRDSISPNYVFSRETDSSTIYYYKEREFDITSYEDSAIPSYFNANHTFYVSHNDTLSDNVFSNTNKYSGYYEYNYYHSSHSTRSLYRGQRNYELLKRNDPDEILALLTNTLRIADAYKVKHNLNADTWFKMVYHPETFEVKHFIRTEPKDEVYDDLTISYEDDKLTQKYFKERLSDYYFKSSDLRNTFDNIEDIKSSNPFEGAIHVFMWLSFFVSALIYMFRVTGLKPLLFSIITVGVLFLLITLIAALSYYLNESGNTVPQFIILYFTLFIGTIILIIPLFFLKKIKKLVLAICLNISIIGFPLYLLLILGIISYHQSLLCEARNLYSEYSYECNTIMSSLELNWSYVLWIFGILFLLGYTSIIKKWKALPES